MRNFEPQPDLFAEGGDPRHTALRALQARLTKFASGLSRKKDFETAAWAGHAIGIEIGELSAASMHCLARCVVDYRTPLFCDTGAFGAFMASTKRSPGSPHVSLDFARILECYDRLTNLISDLNHAEDDLPPPRFVMPDIVADQLASRSLIHEHSAWIKTAIAFPGVSRPIIPIQRGPLPLSEAYERLVVMLDSRDWIVGVPSNAAAIGHEEFVGFLSDCRPQAIHILGAFADSRLTPRLNQVLDAGLADIEVSADANPLRSIIVERGQSAAERRATLALKLGVRARFAELDAWISDMGGRESTRLEFHNAPGEMRRRMLALMCELSGDTATNVMRRYGLTGCATTSLAV